MQPGASALTPPTGYDTVQLVDDTPYPDPNNPTATLRDLLFASRNTGGVDARTTTTETISTASRGKLVTLSNSSAIAVSLDSTVDSKYLCFVENIGTGTATLTPSSGQIEGAASATLCAGEAMLLVFDGTNWRAPRLFANRRGNSGVAQMADSTTNPTSGNLAAFDANGNVKDSGISSTDTFSGLVEAIGITVDGGGSAIASGSKGFFQTQFAGTILGVTLLADQAGSIQFDIRKCTYSGFPTDSSIVASDPPTLSSAQNSNDTTLTGWTTAFSDGDIFEYKVTSATTVTRVALILRVKRS